MEQLQKIKFLEINLARQLGWIESADSKANFIFMLDVAMLGLLATVSPLSTCTWTLASGLLASLSASLRILSLLFLSIASFPITQGPSDSLIFFGEIVKRDIDQFISEIELTTLDKYTIDLAEQCYRNAEIANRKFEWIQRALLFLYLSVLPWGIAIYFLYNIDSK